MNCCDPKNNSLRWMKFYMSKLAKSTYLWRLKHWGHLVENLQLVNIHPVKIIKLGFVEKNYLWVETRWFVNCHPVENSMMKLYITHFISLHMTYFVSSLRSARRRCRINVVCFCFARFKNRLNSSEGLKDLFMSIGWNKYKPSRVRTLERTTYSQFLKRPPFGHEVTLITSFDIPSNLWPEMISRKCHPVENSMKKLFITHFLSLCSLHFSW